MRTLIALAVLLGGLLTGSVYPLAAQVDDAQRVAPITLMVETEGTDEFAQAGDDLSKIEMARLRSLIEKGLSGNHRLVPADYKDSHLFLSVVATKFFSKEGNIYFAASSALGVGTVQGHLESLTHNVIVQPNLEKMAAAVTFYQSTFELQSRLGLLDNP